MAKDKKEIGQVVSKIFNWLQAAVGDLASDTARYPDMMGEDVNKMIKGMRKRGATDITGCIADHYYNDKEILGDLVGDRVCDEVGYETPEFYAVLEKLQEIGHPALKLAVEEILNQHPRKE